MSQSEPVARHAYQDGQLDEVLEFLKRTRNELRTLRRVRVWTDRMQLFDVNGDYFEVTGVGYPDADIVPVLKAVDAVFKQASIHEPTPREFKEFKTGRRYPWARDRVM